MESKPRRDPSDALGTTRIGGSERPNVRTVLGYALSPLPKQCPALVTEFEGLDLHSAPLGHSDTFLEYDCVVLFAGVFEQVPNNGWDQPPVAYHPDLERRVREAYTMLDRGTPLVILVPRILDQYNGERIPDNSDLFRRVLAGAHVAWHVLNAACSDSVAEIPEFADFIERHGTARVGFLPADVERQQGTMIVCRGKGVLGFSLRESLFVLPCHTPLSHEQAIQIAALAASGVFAYRDRISKALPEWANDFQFSRETELRAEVEKHRAVLDKLNASIDVYVRWKGALCYKSDPLVEVVVELLRSVFGLQVEVDEKKIEDAKVIEADGHILAPVEIKGDSGSFKRPHVNQVDDHRTRLGLPPDVRGLLIMNTMLKASGLAEKDHTPDSGVIGKAVADNVVMIRTLDLLRYADLIERGKLTRDSFREHIFGNSGGWLRVQGDAAELVTT